MNQKDLKKLRGYVNQLKGEISEEIVDVERVESFASWIVSLCEGIRSRQDLDIINDFEAERRAERASL